MNGGLHIMSHLRFVCTVYDAHCAYDAHSVELRAWRCATCLLFMCINRLWNHDKFKVSSYFGGRKCNKVVIYGIRNVMLLGAIKILRCFTCVQYVLGCISGAFLMSTTATDTFSIYFIHYTSWLSTLFPFVQCPIVSIQVLSNSQIDSWYFITFFDSLLFRQWIFTIV